MPYVSGNLKTPVSFVKTMPLSTAHPKALRTSRFSFRDPLLLCARARLYPDWLDLTGWYWRGRYHRRVPLNHLLQVDVTGSGHLLLWLASGEAIRLRLADAAAWKEAIDVALAI